MGELVSPIISFFNFYLYYILLYNTVLVLPYIDMNPPWVHILNPPPTSLPTPSLWVIPVHQPQASYILLQTLHDIIHVSVSFSQIIPPSPSPTESKRLFYTSVSLLLPLIQGYCYHLSKFHIYVLIYCIGVFCSNLLCSV